MIARYTRPGLGAAWTDEARMQAWRQVEIAACEELPALLGPGDGPTAAELEAIRQASFTGPVALIDSFVDSSTVSAMGSYANGLLVSGLLDPVTQASSPGVEAFVKAMNSESPSAPKDGLAEHSWNGFDLFGQVAKTISGDITAASLLKALQNVTTPITLGLSGPWVSPNASNAPISQYPRLSKDALSYIPEKIEGGQLVATGSRVYLAS